MLYKRWNPILFFSIVIFTASLSAGLLGLGKRNLWVDEVETAERARSILDNGTPQIWDAEGRPSLSALGKEIEEGPWHRYTPWAQFYVGAAGLLLGDVFGWHQDFAVRFPFALLHALTTLLAALALFWIFSPKGINQQSTAQHSLLAGLAGLSFGWSSLALAHHRTARYHSPIAFFFVLGVFCFLLILKKNTESKTFAKLFKKAFSYFGIALSVVGLLHSQTIAGLAAVGTLGILFFIFVLPHLRKQYLIKNLTHPFALTFFAGINVGLVSLLALIRPWAQTAWGHLEIKWRTDQLANSMLMPSWMLIFLTAIVFFTQKKRLQGFKIAAVLAGFTLLVLISGFHPYSQARYFIWIQFLPWAIFALLACKSEISNPFRVDDATRKTHKFVWLILGLNLYHEFASPIVRPFQMLSLAIHDQTASQWSQPVHQAIAWIQENEPTSAIYWEYVPQIVNWYLPKTRIALLPDSAAMTELGLKNPKQEQGPFPRVHVYYTSWNDNMACTPNCDARMEPIPCETEKFWLLSKRLQRRELFCVRKKWATSQWNNAPFELVQKEAFLPESEQLGYMVLSTPCEVEKHELRINNCAQTIEKVKKGAQ